MREVQDLDQAYQIARDAERFTRGPIFCRPEAPRTSAPSQPPRPSQMRPNQPNPSQDKGKAPEVQRSPNTKVVCFKCHKAGHYAGQCPTRALHIGELEEEESEPIEPLDDCVEEVYQAEDNLVDEYEGDEDLVDPDLLGVVRYILIQN